MPGANYHHTESGRGNCPSSGLPTNGENALDLELLLGEQRLVGLPTGPVYINVTEKRRWKYSDWWAGWHLGFQLCAQHGDAERNAAKWRRV